MKRLTPPQVLDFPSPLRKYHKCRVRLLSQGLPRQNNMDGAEPGMCVPVFPTTANPLERAALCTSAPLPWENCYHHSAMHVVLRVVIEPDDVSSPTLIGFDDMFEHDFCVREDEERQKMLRSGRLRTVIDPSDWVDSLSPATSGSERSPSSSNSTAVSSPSLVEDLTNSRSSTSPVAYNTDGAPTLDAALLPLYADLMDGSEIPDTTPCAVARYTLNASLALVDPSHLFMEIASMMECVLERFSGLWSTSNVESKITSHSSVAEDASLTTA